MNDRDDGAERGAADPHTDKTTGIKLVVLVFALPLLLVLLAQFLVF